MAQKRQRIAAVIAALIFLGSSLGASGYVIYLLATNKDKPAATTPAATPSTAQQPATNPKVGQKMDNFTPVATVSELQATDTKVGDGAAATATSKVTVAYVGALAKDGTIFDASSDGKPVSLSLDQVIKGWQQGVPGMKVGGSRRLLIPAALAYGAQSPAASIPANSDLVFDITLIAVQ
jgi:FKBP-type peptidyl-prolyl cis-trans isomerase